VALVAFTLDRFSSASLLAIGVTAGIAIGFVWGGWAQRRRDATPHDPC
jgi:hypothetical protein